MTLTSYAQNYEDVMLWRALGHVPHGFYIDVGAFSPDLDSVTRAFSDRGWRGINLEPNPHYLAQLNARRPHDINLGIAVSDFDGQIELSVIADTGLTTVDAAVADEHVHAGWQMTRIEVPAHTLAHIWDHHVPPGQTVHFLKIDVEGHEAAVLRGADWSRHRPCIVVVEATIPGTQISCHAEWEKILEDADYIFAYWDGLNRFYVAKEHGELTDKLSSPPNVFDDFILYRHEEARARVDLLEGSVSDLKAALVKQEQLQSTLSELKTALVKQDQLQSTVSELRTALVKQDELQSTVGELKTALVNQDRLQSTVSELKTALAKQDQLHGAIGELKMAVAQRLDLEKTIEREMGDISRALAIVTHEGHAQRYAVTVALYEAREFQQRVDFFINRSALQRLLLRTSGRPRSPVRMLFFHSSGKPRGMFRRWIVHRGGQPRDLFKQWMISPAYLALRYPAQQAQYGATGGEAPQDDISPRGQYFLNRLKASRTRGGKT